MNHSYHTVDPALRAYLRTILVIDSTSDADSTNLPLVTSGMPALVYQMGEDTGKITLHGQSVPYEDWTSEKHPITLIACFFKPFALGTIFNRSAQELKKGPVALENWNAPKATILCGQLQRAESITEKTALLSAFILDQLSTRQHICGYIRRATDQLMVDYSAGALSNLLQELHLTERTFQRMFKKYVGITPGQYRRICQFQFAFSQLKGGHFTTQSDVALTNGYFDQSHYIRSFKAFTATTPDEYVQNGLVKKK